MAAKTTIILLISLLSLSATTTLATFISPLIIPSCCVNYDAAKCYADYKAAYAAKASAEMGAVASAVPIALSVVKAANASCSSALQFMSTMKGVGVNIPAACQDAFSFAVNNLSKACDAMEGKTDLSKSTVADVQKQVQDATQNVMKCVSSFSSDKNPASTTIASEPAKICNIALSFCKMMGY